MPSNSDKLLQEAVRQHLSDFASEGCFGVTLTMKQYENGCKLDAEGAPRWIRLLLNRLNTQVYGKSFRRFGKRLRVVSAYEYSATGRLHYHLALENPFPESPDTFERLIRANWAMCPYAYQQVHVHQKIDSGWINYITKSRSAGDSVDWLNSPKNCRA